MTDLDNRIVEFSTDHIPEKDRIALWREHYGHVMLRVDLEPARDTAFEARIASLALPGLQLMEASSSPAKVSRSGRYLADGNDDIVVAVNRTGSVNVASGGREQSLREGDAIVLSGGEVSSFHRTSMGRSFTLRVPRAMFEQTVVSLDDALMRPIPGDRGALRLLVNYAGWLLNAGSSIDQQLRNVSVRHVQDLLALAVGPSADFADTARTRGLRAARLKLGKSYIVAHSHRREISVGSLAATLNVTPRYVQRVRSRWHDILRISHGAASRARTQAVVRARRESHRDQHHRLRRRLRRSLPFQPPLPPSIRAHAARTARRQNVIEHVRSRPTGRPAEPRRFESFGSAGRFQSTAANERRRSRRSRRRRQASVSYCPAPTQTFFRSSPRGWTRTLRSTSSP